jgi:hypothetical protein
LFVVGGCLSLVVVCRWLLFVVGRCLSLVVVCRWLLFVIGRCFLLDTRPKPAYGRQGLDWIVGPGYSFAVFSTVGQSDHFS